MRTIKPDSRDRLTAHDFDFIAEALRHGGTSSGTLSRLLADPHARDEALDSEPLFRAILQLRRTVPISPQLYFYVLSRRVLTGFDREIADYVASVLTAFSRCDPEGTDIYITDLLAALQAVSSEDAFFIRAEVGNYSLFLSGVFPRRIQHRAANHGAPDISFYEQIGSTSFRLASHHQLARKHDLGDVYRDLGDRFSELRHHLNHLADEFFCLKSA
jgi:hypothetical protein